MTAAKDWHANISILVQLYDPPPVIAPPKPGDRAWYNGTAGKSDLAISDLAISDVAIQEREGDA